MARGSLVQAELPREGGSLLQPSVCSTWPWLGCLIDWSVAALFDGGSWSLGLPEGDPVLATQVAVHSYQILAVWVCGEVRAMLELEIIVIGEKCVRRYGLQPVLQLAQICPCWLPDLPGPAVVELCVKGASTATFGSAYCRLGLSTSSVLLTVRPVTQAHDCIWGPKL